jgi:cytochrome c peroxidase
MVGKRVCIARRDQSRLRRLLGVVTLVVVTATIATGLSTAHAKPAKPMPGEPAPEAPKSLKSVKVPLPKDLDKYIKDKKSAIQLGKAFFWDMQVGSDGKTACASCHFHAGVDNRTRNTIAPRGDKFRGANKDLVASDFPFHRLANPNKKAGPDNPVVFDTSEVVGSQGVVKKKFRSILRFVPIDLGTDVADPVFQVNGVNVRQVTGRNAPTVINAVFNDRNFWDGRANHFFNGVNPFGETDPDARVWKADKSGKLSKVKVLLENASLASQAVGPPNNSVEMSWDGRTFPDLGRKLLSLRPLALQRVHSNDSVLGKEVSVFGRGLKTGYGDLIKESFHPEWWNSRQITPEGDTLMEANFALYWGLAVMMYESTLVSDETPFDRFADGDKKALGDKAKLGLELFLNEGKCINCHSGPEFTGATVSQLRSDKKKSDETLIEFMAMQRGDAFYDSGFYNIGVRPTAEDLGLGGRHPQFGPFALSRRVQEGLKPDLNGQKVNIARGDRIAVDGAFKTPTMRNVELTGPYMHNGGMRTLTEVVQFYVRRADFFEQNIQDLDPDVDGVEEMRGDAAKIEAMVEFLKSLTDERVRFRKAPFDHPELIVPNGHSRFIAGQALDNNVVIPAVGKDGGNAIQPFENVVK